MAKELKANKKVDVAKPIPKKKLKTLSDIDTHIDSLFEIEQDPSKVGEQLDVALLEYFKTSEGKAIIADSLYKTYPPEAIVALLATDVKKRIKKIKKIKDKK